MEQNQLSEAFEKALSNPKVISLVATLVAKEMIAKKSNPKTDEAKLAKDHVVFAQADSTTGVWLTVKEISEKIAEFREGAIRPRVFGKHLMADAVKTKDSAMGRKYFIEGVFEEITTEVLELIANPVDETAANEVETTAEEVSNERHLTYEDLQTMGVEELLEVNKAVEFMKPKKAKKLDADELRAGLIEELGLKKAKKVKAKDVDASDIDAAPTADEVAEENAKETPEVEEKKKSKKDKKNKKDKKKNKKK